MNLSNHERAGRASKLLRISAVRLLADLRHWCDGADLVFPELLELSHARYLEDLAEEAWGTPRPRGGEDGEKSAA